jgi:hypothetical protein
MPEGSLRASAPGEFSGLRLASAAHTFASATVTVDTLAVGDVVTRVWFEVTTAYNAGTTNVVTVGDGTTANKYLAAADITEATPAVYPTGGSGPFKAETAGGTLTVTYAQTGTAATTGAGRCYALIASAPE